MDQMMFDRLTRQPANRNLLQETLSVTVRTRPRKTSAFGRKMLTQMR